MDQLRLSVVLLIEDQIYLPLALPDLRFIVQLQLLCLSLLLLQNHFQMFILFLAVFLLLIVTILLKLEALLQL